MGILKAFHHVAVKAKDFEKSVEFYTKTLQLKQIKAWGEGDGRAVMLELGDGSCMELFAGGSNIDEQICPIQHIAFNVNDPFECTEIVRKAGCEITIEPKEVEVPGNPGLHAVIAFCKGPDGEILEFFKPL